VRGATRLHVKSFSQNREEILLLTHRHAIGVSTQQGHITMRIASQVLAFLAAAAISGLTLGATIA
jgi:hypothetical protein